MSGVEVEIEGVEYAGQVFDGLIRKAENTKPLMDVFGAYLVGSTQTRIADEKQTPSGTKWAGYKNSAYARLKAKKSSGGLLELDGYLLNSIAHIAEDGAVIWGSSREYAARQHFGGGGVIARRFLGISRRDRDVILGLTKEYYLA